MNDVMLPSRRALQLTDYLEPMDCSTSFAIIGGPQNVRDYIGMYALSRACGRMGVIVLHGDRSFEASLSQVVHLNKSIAQHCPDFRALFVNSGEDSPDKSFYYSPLFGLSEGAALNALTRSERAGFRQLPHHVLPALRCYWRILQESGQDACLDTLLTLTEMPLSMLEKQVLSQISERRRAECRATLSIPNAQQDAWSAVLSFAYGLENRLWTPRDQHTGLSLVTAVRNRQLISLYLQPNQSEVTDYLDIELQAMASEGLPFLLVGYGLSLKDNALYPRFFSEHTGYTTGIISASLTNILGVGQSDASTLLSTHPDTVVLSCQDSTSAEAFSYACGHVLLRDLLRSTGRQRRAWESRGTYTVNWTEQMREDRAIRPDVLRNLNGGALLTNPARNGPLLVRKLQLP